MYKYISKLTKSAFFWIYSGKCGMYGKTWEKNVSFIETSN